MKKKLLWLAGLALVVVLLLSMRGQASGSQEAAGVGRYIHWVTGLFSARPEQPKKGMRDEAVPVRVGTAIRKSMPVHLSNVGRVEAYSIIDVRAQVPGELVKVHFNEGDTVEQGQILFTIDPRPYEVALKEAEANLAKAQAQVDQSKANRARNQAQADNAQAQFERDSHLLSKGMVAPEEVDSVKASAEALKAAVQADEAATRSAVETVRAARVAIDDAKLRLEYCTIRSPLKGKTGSLLVHQGNLVRINDAEPLVTITQTQPIYVSFTLPDKRLATVREHMAKGPLEVQAVVSGGGEPAKGVLTFIDNAVNETTGTIRLKATFDNADERLWPGQFVDVSLQVSVLEDALVAPTPAVQSGQAGTYVYVVKPDMTVELRPVKQGDVQGDLTIIEEGLQPDEKVVTDGHLRLAPGSKIKISEEPGTPVEAKK